MSNPDLSSFDSSELNQVHETHPPLEKLSRKRSLGVHIKMSRERVTRKMLSISINRRDGGIMVVPHLQNWGIITAAQFAVTDSWRVTADTANATNTGGENRPKLHYHRSGMTSVQPQQYTGAVGRKTIHLPSLDELDTVQIFSVAARLPGLLPWNQLENSWDVIHILDRPAVKSLQISGVIYNRSKIDAGSIGGMEGAGPLTLASGHNNAVFVDLSGYGLESVLGLFFNPSTLSLPNDAADFTLASFHPQQMLAQGGVAIYAGGGRPTPSLLADIPDVSSIHSVAALQPVGSNIERILKNDR